MSTISLFDHFIIRTFHLSVILFLNQYSFLYFLFLVHVICRPFYLSSNLFVDLLLCRLFNLSIILFGEQRQRHTHRDHAHGSRQRRLEAVGASPGCPSVSDLDRSATELISLGRSVETVLTFFSFYLFRFCLT